MLTAAWHTVGMAEVPYSTEESGLRSLAFAAAFFCVTSLTIYSTRFSGGLALAWFGTAILAALLVTMPYRAWPRTAIFFIALSTCATTLFGFGPALALPLALVNVFEGCLIAGLLVRSRPERDYLENWSGFAKLIAFAGLVGPGVAAIPGGAAVSAVVGGTWHHHAFEWLASHGLGTLLALPLALLFARGSVAGLTKMATRSAWWELAGFSLAIAGVALLAFYQTAYPILFLPMLPLTLACFRFGRTGAAVSVLLIAMVASASLVAGVGPFGALPAPLAEKAMFLQFYLVVVLLTSLPVATALKHREVLHSHILHREALQRLISDHSDDALLTLDAAGRVRFASPAGLKLSARTSLEELPLALFFDDADAHTIEDALGRAAEEPGVTKVVERAVTRGEEIAWLEAKIRAVAGDTAAPASYVVTVRDVTARKKHELEAVRDACTDPLTGLPNRRAFLKVLEPGLRAACERPVSLAIIDLDHFKTINDRYGHDVGDLVLRHVGSIMKRLASEECFFARLGGEEFGMIAWHADAAISAGMCERLREEINAHQIRDADGGMFGVSASVGLARLSEPCDAALALQTADSPLYSAKAAGRNRVHVAQGPPGWKHRARSARGPHRILRCA